MNVDEALMAVRRRFPFGADEFGDIGRAAYLLAREVGRLRGELLKANAEQERLENQLDQVRGELVATCARIEAWEDALEDCIPAIDEQMRS